MTSAHSLQGLMKWLTRAEWRDRFAEVYDHHLLPTCLMPITPGSYWRYELKCPAVRAGSVVQVCPRGGTYCRSSSQITHCRGATLLGVYWVPQAVQMNASISLFREHAL